jgi:threonine/homoserine/homoserine lactone efflux protein
MAEAIGQVLSFAVVVSLSPIPIIGVVLMLGTPAGRRNGPAFLVGWIAGLAVVGALVLVVAGAAGAGDTEEPATWVVVLKLVLGGLLLLMAARQWRGRPRRGEEAAALPKWMQTVDHFTAARSAALGVALSAINPKNLLLTVAAAAAIAQAGVSTGDEFVAMAVFVVIGTLGPGIPVVLYFALGERAARMLDELKAWLGAHNAAIMAVLLLVIGAKLIGDGISGLG